MEATISTLLERAQGFFSRSFTFAGLLPALALLALNGLLIPLVFPAARAPFAALLSPQGIEQLPVWLLLTILVIVVGLVLWGLNPALLRLMEGRFLPDGAARSLRRKRAQELARLRVQREERGELVQYRLARLPGRGWEAQLKEARAQGEDQGTVDGDRPLPDDLIQAYERLQRMEARREIIAYGAMEALFEALRQALQTFSAAKIRDLDQMQIGFSRLLAYAAEQTELAIALREQALATARRQRFPFYFDPGATRVSSLAAAHREQVLLRYGMDVELFWPRLLKFARADESFYPILEDARVQLDFSIAITTVLSLTTAVWFLLALAFAPQRSLALLIGLLGPLLSYLGYQTLLRNYQAFTETARSAIDLFRFDLLEQLRVKDLPENPVQEKALWERLTSLARGETGAPLAFDHDGDDAPRGPNASG